VTGAEISFPENLTREQSEAVEKAAFLILTAQKEAKATLARARVPRMGSGSGSKVRARRTSRVREVPVQRLHRRWRAVPDAVTVDPGASPPLRSCGHPPSKHLST